MTAGPDVQTRVLLVLCVTVAFAPALAVADDWSDFIPRPFENGGFLDAYTSYERDHLQSGGPSTHWNDTFLRQKITLYSNGYVYHPRFLLYRISVAGLQKEEDFETSGVGSTGWNYGWGAEYDASVLLLPEHPYNLLVYGRRFEPLIKEQAATQHNNVEQSEGFSFRYRDKPYFAHIGFLDDSIESGDASSEVMRFNLDGEYFKRFVNGNEFSVTGGFNPSWFSNSEGLDGSSTEYLLNNFLSLEQLPVRWVLPGRLTSSVTKDLFDQETSTSGKLENDQLVWYERLTLTPPKWLLDSAPDLPLNFRSDVYWRYQDNHNTAPGTSLSDISKDLQVDVIHRLYESVDTTYTYLDDSRSSSGGESSAMSHSLVLNYTKTIPRGRILIGGNAGTSDTDNFGESSILDEPHLGITVPNLPGSFILGQQNVDSASIQVFVVCSDNNPCPPPLVSGQRVLLTENANYQVLPVPGQNTFEIRVLNNLPPPLVPGTYDFLVSYAVSGDFRLRIDTLGGSASVELLDQLLTPYFNYSQVRTHVVAGVFPGIPLDSTTYTTGMIVRYGPWQVRGEYQDLEWQVSPYRSYLAEVQYVKALSETTSLFASGFYQNRYYPHGTSDLSGTPVNSNAAYTEETESASGSIQKALFDRDLYASIGGSYAHVQGLIDTDSYSANGSVIWKVGKVDLTLGVNAYGSDTSGTNTMSTKRDHEFVYLNLRRRLF